MTTRNYTFASEPAGKTYSLLLSSAVGLCKRTLLVVRPDLGLSSAGADLLERLRPHGLRAHARSSWPGTVLVQGSASVHESAFNATVARTLHSAAQRLFQWRQPELPEDLCLLREDGSPWLTTIAHEQEAYLSLSDAELEKLNRRFPEFTSTLRV
jgi:hypothetical protein